MTLLLVSGRTFLLVENVLRDKRRDMESYVVVGNHEHCVPSIIDTYPSIYHSGESTIMEQYLYLSNIQLVTV